MKPSSTSRTIAAARSSADYFAGGIGTTLFYLTIGRRGSVSDIEYIARMHGMTRAQSTLVFGGVAAMHTIRIARDPHYANFFARPRVGGGMDVGIQHRRAVTIVVVVFGICSV